MIPPPSDEPTATHPLLLILEVHRQPRHLAEVFVKSQLLAIEADKDYLEVLPGLLQLFVKEDQHRRERPAWGAPLGGEV